ncbi:MAG: hypothetical protein ABEN55_06830, partial [Bradymonadaceae bacterium]
KSCPGPWCFNYLAFCSSADADPSGRLTSLMPAFDLYCTPYEESAVCDATRLPEGGECRRGDWCCVLRDGDRIDGRKYRQLCRMSLLPGGCAMLE